MLRMRMRINTMVKNNDVSVSATILWSFPSDLINQFNFIPNEIRKFLIPICLKSPLGNIIFALVVQFRTLESENLKEKNTRNSPNLESWISRYKCKQRHKNRIVFLKGFLPFSPTFNPFQPNSTEFNPKLTKVIVRFYGRVCEGS